MSSRTRTSTKTNTYRHGRQSSVKAQDVSLGEVTAFLSLGNLAGNLDPIFVESGASYVEDNVQLDSIDDSELQYNYEDDNVQVAPKVARDETIWYYDFINSSDLSDFTVKEDDGVARKSARGLLIDSTTFKTSCPQSYNGQRDNLKWQIFHKDDVEVYGDEILYEGVVSACQIFDRRPIPKEFIPRVRNIFEDYRLCCAALTVQDDVSMIGAHFLITNSAIYAMYERKSEKKDFRNALRGFAEDEPKCEVQPYACFSSSALVQRRGRGYSNSVDILDDTYRLAIGIDNINGVIRWYVDRIEVFHVNRIGYRLDDQYQVLDGGGAPRLTTIKSFKVGFGHYTFLDHQLPNNYSRMLVRCDTGEHGGVTHRSESGLVMLCPEEHYKEPLPDIYGRYCSIVPEVSFAIPCGTEGCRIFGQGIISCVKSLRLYTRQRSTAPIICPIREIDDYRHTNKYYNNDDDQSDIIPVDRSEQTLDEVVVEDGIDSDDSLFTLLDEVEIKEKYPNLTSFTNLTTLSEKALRYNSDNIGMESLTNVSARERRSEFSLITPHPSVPSVASVPSNSQSSRSSTNRSTSGTPQVSTESHNSHLE